MSAALRKIRAAVCLRAAGACESCGAWVGENGESGHLDHARGRARSETVESCWLLCVPCDDERTHNRPTSAHWLRLFAAHCADYGFAAEHERALARLQFVTARGAA